MSDLHPPNGEAHALHQLADERHAIARLLLRRASATSNKAVAEALRMAAADVVERTPGDVLPRGDALELLGKHLGVLKEDAIG